MAIEKVCGVYMIWSIIKPYRFYIGGSVFIHKRRDEHFRELRKNKHTNKKMQYHYNKYGENDLVFITIERVDALILSEREQLYLDKLNPYFNECKVVGRPKGGKMTAEIRRKIGDANRGKVHSPETIQKQRDSHKGQRFSPEVIAKRAMARRGKKRSPEAIRKTAEKRRGQKMTPEQCLKISINKKEWFKTHEHHQKGVPVKDDTKEKISKTLVVFFNNHPEAKKHLSDIGKGRKLSETTKKKMSVAQNIRRRREQDSIG